MPAPDSTAKKDAPLFPERSRVDHRILTRIRPNPPVQITFDEVRGVMVAKIAVAKGDAPPYMMRGTIYLRQGSSDVQAQPEDVVRLVSKHKR